MKSAIFWLIWLGVVIGVIFWLSTQCFGRVAEYRIAMSPKASEQYVPKRYKKSVPVAAPMTKPPWKPGTNVYYFAATALSGQLESDYSSEAIYTNVMRTPAVTLAWDASASTNVTEYRIYLGGKTHDYYKWFSASTNLSITIPLYPTNILIRVAGTNGATDLVFSLSLYGPWISLHATTWTATNPAGPLYWRSVGTQGNRVIITGKAIW